MDGRSFAWRHHVFVTAIILGVFLVLPIVAAQSDAHLPRVGYLGNSPQQGPDPLSEGLHALGWDEGRNVIIERRYTEGNIEQAPQLAAELVRLNVDVIVAAAPPNVRAVQPSHIINPHSYVRGIRSSWNGFRF